jgi:hypothetical protein
MPVEFNEEEKFNAVYRTKPTTIPFLTKWIIKTKLAKSEKGAKNVMAIITIACFALAIYFALK